MKMTNNDKTAVELMLYALNIKPEREYKFHPSRKWRFDWAMPDRKIAIEYEGIISAKSRHTSMVGYSNDCEKYSEAAIMGWTVIRLTVLMCRDGRAFNLLEKALK